MNIGNMEKNVTRDPATANCRIFVGGLAEVINKKEFDEFFGQFGTIKATILNKGFGFVQYENAESAQQAIAIKSVVYEGMRLYIKPCTSNNSPGGGPVPNNNMNMNKQMGLGIQNQMMPERRIPQNFGNNPVLGGPNRGNLTQNNTGMNDCEIIVCSRMQTSYAENIEMQLNHLGLKVDLLFPNGVVPIGKILANISSRGCLYAILVTPQNEDHRSITVNVLYGQPAEHRNMPVDDAIRFIAKDFEQHKKVTPLSLATPSLQESHPDVIQGLLTNLAENRMLTVLQYDKIIKYLQERRELQLKKEVGDDDVKIISPSPAKKEEPKVVEKEKTEEEKLQEKIMSILNKPSISENILNLKAEPAPEDENDDGMGILKDPTVQKALDSLLQSCITFKF